MLFQILLRHRESGSDLGQCLAPLSQKQRTKRQNEPSWHIYHAWKSLLVEEYPKALGRAPVRLAVFGGNPLDKAEVAQMTREVRGGRRLGESPPLDYGILARPEDSNRWPTGAEPSSSCVQELA
jgi:hypothetical protein